MNSLYVSKLNNKEEVRTDNPNDVYRRPIPIDTINRFNGLDSRILKHDDTVQKQSFDQGYKNFWSFVDFNITFSTQDSQQQGNKKSLTDQSKKTSSSEIEKSSGIPSHNKSKTKFNGCTLTYQEARNRANALLLQAAKPN